MKCKAETPFNIRLNNYRNNVKNPHPRFAALNTTIADQKTILYYTKETKCKVCLA